MPRALFTCVTKKYSLFILQVFSQCNTSTQLQETILTSVLHVIVWCFYSLRQVTQIVAVPVSTGCFRSPMYNVLRVKYLKYVLKLHKVMTQWWWGI